MINLGAIPFIWDTFLEPGQARMDLNGILHIGAGTDLQSFLFERNLTDRDREFLKALKVKVD